MISHICLCQNLSYPIFINNKCTLGTLKRCEGDTERLIVSMSVTVALGSTLTADASVC